MRDNVTAKVASHRVRLRFTNQFMVNGSLHTCSVGHIRLNFLSFERLTAYLNQFKFT